MFWSYLFLFIGGVGLGILGWYIEKENEQARRLIRTVIKVLFIVSIVLYSIGLLFVSIHFVITAMSLFFFTLGLFLTRRTFLYLK